MERAAGRKPLAALLFGKTGRPAAAQLSDIAARTDAFSVINTANAVPGHAELLRDGLTFDLAGLAPAPTPTLGVPEAAHRVALPQDFSPAGCEAVWFTAGPHLAGAEHLSPVLRGAAAVLHALTGLEGLDAVIWCPARLVVSPVWFAEAIGVWLAGGPFPALALTALARSDSSLTSEGLAFFTGQEFTLWGKDGAPSREDSRIAVRLMDWLYAHGRVDSPREVVLMGVGPVWLEPDGANSLNVRAR